MATRGALGRLGSKRSDMGRGPGPGRLDPRLPMPPCGHAFSQERYGNLTYNKQNLGDVFCIFLGTFFWENVHWTNVMLYFLMVTPGSEHQKDARRSCDQLPGSSASRWLFWGPFTKDLVFYILIQKPVFWGPPPGEGGDGDGDSGRIFQQHQPPPHRAQGYHIPFGSLLWHSDIVCFVYHICFNMSSFKSYK